MAVLGSMAVSMVAVKGPPAPPWGGMVLRGMQAARVVLVRARRARLVYIVMGVVVLLGFEGWLRGFWRRVEVVDGSVDI